MRTTVPRVVITGIGVVSPFGPGRERFWDHVRGGCSGTRAITDFDASEFACRVAAPVPPVTVDDVPPLDGDNVRDPRHRADPKRYSRAALIGVIAAREAWADAGLRIGEPNAGVIIGSGGGGIDVGERQYYDFFVDRGRDGFVLGEGAWMIVLEREDRARARGARMYASIDGYASTCDAYHRVQMAPDGEEIVRAISLAVERAGRGRDAIGYVSYHGTSTVLNDAVESRCVRQVFGDHADRLAGSSVKSMIGHPQGASGAAGVVTAALALSRDFLPPTINLHDADPACDLEFIPNQGRRAAVAAALCNCLGFGSKNSAIVLGRI